MGIVEKLLWIWNPQTQEQKDYAKWDKSAPHQQRTQKLLVYIKDIDDPLVYDYVVKDWAIGKENFRWASVERNFNIHIKHWIEERACEGIFIDDVWYGPESILRIELDKQTLEDL